MKSKFEFFVVLLLTVFALSFGNASNANLDLAKKGSFDITEERLAKKGSFDITEERLAKKGSFDITELDGSEDTENQ